MSVSEKHRKRLRLEGFHYADPNYVYFVTLRAACGQGMPLLNSELASSIIDALLYQRQAGHARVYAYVVMPDHLHVALSPSEAGRSIADVVRDLKSFTTRQAWSLGIRGRLWERSYFDRIARCGHEAITQCEYILANPVRKGLAASPKEWRYLGMPDVLPLA
ncbi:MAG: REP-associated tyrosine transposase [Chloroflexota bacterium]